MGEGKKFFLFSPYVNAPPKKKVLSVNEQMIGTPQEKSFPIMKLVRESGGKGRSFISFWCVI